MEREFLSIEPRKIGGWLYLLAVGLVIGLIYTVVIIGENLSFIGTTDWNTVIEAYPIYLPVYLYETLINLLSAGFTVHLLYLFGRQKRQFRRLFIFYNLVELGLTFLYIIIMGLLPPDFEVSAGDTMAPFMTQFWYSVIWITYMLRSQRVRETFILPKYKDYNPGKTSSI